MQQQNYRQMNHYVNQPAGNIGNGAVDPSSGYGQDELRSRQFTANNMQGNTAAAAAAAQYSSNRGNQSS